MSIKLMNAVWQSTLDGTSKAIALAYADFAADDGSGIYPSLDYMERKTGFSRSTVRRYTKQLLDAGIMQLVHDETKPTNVYKFVASNLPGGVSVTRGGCQPDTGGVSHRHGGGVSLTPNPSIEPSINREREPRSAKAEPTPPHLAAFEAQFSAPDIEEKLRDICTGSKAKRMSAAGQLKNAGAKAADLGRFPRYWKEKYPRFEQPWPIQVVDEWPDYLEWLNQNRHTVNAQPDWSGTPQAIFAARMGASHD